MKTSHAASDACELALKFRYEDLGKAMARRWNLPDTVVNCMEDAGFSPAESDLERLRIISSFSHALSGAVYRNDVSECEPALKALLRRYGPALPVKESEIPSILEAAVFETEDTFRVARLTMDRASVGKQILAATGRAGELSGNHKLPAPAPLDRTDMLDNLLKEVRTMLGGAEEFDLNSALMTILEAFYRGLGLDRTLFCLVNGEDACVQARLGVGADIERLIDKFKFPISIRSGPIASALLAKDDVILDAGAGKCNSRSAFAQVTGATCFGILPLIVEGIVVGCLYFDSASDNFAFDARMRQALLELRGFAVQAISRQRQSR